MSAAVTDGIQSTDHDVLKAVKLVKDGNSYTLSGAVEVAVMGDDILIGHFNTDLDGKKLQLFILGTNYSATTEKTVAISDGNDDNVETATITVATPVIGMYTADAEFTNQFTLPTVSLKYLQSRCDDHLRDAGHHPLAAGEFSEYGERDLGLSL